MYIYIYIVYIYIYIYIYIFLGHRRGQPEAALAPLALANWAITLSLSFFCVFCLSLSFSVFLCLSLYNYYDNNKY